MAIVGLGTDIVQIARIEEAVARSSRFAQRILSVEEMAVYQQHKQPARYLAKRFAAKEAAAKALGTGIGNGLSFQHMTVANNAVGAPLLRFDGEGLALCEARGVAHYHLSISDEQDYAVATVIFESR